MPRSRTMLVAGAGIGGLAAAVGLARQGFRVVVMERALHLEEIGAGIQLSPNGTRALDRLGVLDRVRDKAVEARELRVGDGASGRELARTSLAEAAARYGAPWLLTLRADLHRAISASARDEVDISFELGAELFDFAQHPRGVTALTQRNGKQEEYLGLGLIGADGLWSRVRERLHGKALPAAHGLVAWRAVVPARSLPAKLAEPVVYLWLGPEAHLVHYPVAGGEQINVVIVYRDDWHADGWTAPADFSKMPDACDGWSAIPQQVIGTAKDFRRWALADREPVERWGEGSVTLLGDAAHPMLPFLAQGATAAIEDAVTLARNLARFEASETGMRAYEAERISRTARLQKAARFSGRVYHADGILRWLRDLRLKRGSDLLSHHAWIYRYRPV